MNNVIWGLIYIISAYLFSIVLFKIFNKKENNKKILYVLGIIMSVIFCFYFLYGMFSTN